MKDLESLLRQLNPTAKILRAVRGELLLHEVLNTGSFHPKWAEQHQSWLAVPRGSEVSEQDEYSFGSFVYEARRPFHPERLMEFVEGMEFDQIVRSKGLIWLATRHDSGGDWSQAGRVFSLDPAGRWTASLPTEDWPDDDDYLKELRDVWREPWGDRRRELIIIGRSLNRQAASLLTSTKCTMRESRLAVFWPVGDFSSSWQTTTAIRVATAPTDARSTRTPGL